MLPDFSIKAEPVCHGCEWETPLGLFRLTNSMVIMFVVMAALIIPALLVRRNVDMVPGTAQNVMEFILEAVEGLVGSALGRYNQQLYPLIASFFILILFSNWFSLLPLVGTVGYIEVHDGHEVLIPFLRPATADINLTLALAISAFLVIHSTGIRAHGLIGHIKAVAQNSPLLFPIFLVIELFVIVSLSFRLFGNLFAGEVLLGLANWQGWVVGAIFLVLELLFGLIQAIVFTMLTVSFTSVSIGSEEHH
ncbi:MAG TPA: F0F1 ATP synthase subunit A [Chloroflexota bacterium]|nr:F0F1 ATP synthase subunit A [Chloroflexota bacterium]